MDHSGGASLVKSGLVHVLAQKCFLEHLSRDVMRVINTRPTERDYAATQWRQSKFIFFLFGGGGRNFIWR